jgi:hypothetical protein
VYASKHPMPIPDTDIRQMNLSEIDGNHQYPYAKRTLRLIYVHSQDYIFKALMFAGIHELYMKNRCSSESVSHTKIESSSTATVQIMYWNNTYNQGCIEKYNSPLVKEETL